MNYEPIQRNDLDGCARAFVEVFNSAPWNEHWTTSSALTRLREIFDTPGFQGLKVLDARIIGFVMGYAELFDDGSDFYLTEMCVLPSEQRKGIGTALLQELTEKLVSGGVRKICLLTSREGPAAAFYAKNGFYTSDKMVMMGHWLRPRE